MRGPFRERILSGKALISDGATGTNLMSRGLPRGQPVESWVFEKPEKIVELHRDFIEAGAELLLTCTFGASPVRLEGGKLAGRSIEINRRAVELAHQAVGDRPVYIGGSMGPSGQLMKPIGPLDEAGVVDSFAEQAKALADAGVDLLVVETQFDLTEARAAVQAIHSVTDLPVVCSFSYDRGMRTMMGVKPAQMAEELAPFELVAVGINCGRSLEENFKALQELRKATDLPIWFKPNAGTPEVDEQGQTYYNTTPEQMGQMASDWLTAGAQIIGGCCGTTPDHLRQIAATVRSLRKG